nr:hypothetical protein [uncultured Erwinia sp.]
MMDRRILQLGQALEQAADRESWDDIRRIDARITQLLQAIHEQGLQDALRDDLTRLQRSHQRAAKACREQHDLLQMKIQQFQQNRERLQAYALFSESNEENQ